MSEVDTGRSRARVAIVDAAARILGENGPAAVTTRAVAAAAGVQAPTIYRIFGDKEGLLEAVAEHVMTTFVASKAKIVADAASADVDPVADLRAGWTTQLEFGLANPDLFRLLSDPRRVAASPAAAAGRRVLEARIRRVAQAGRLRVSEQRAVGMIMAAGTGAIQAILATPVEQRDAGLADAVHEAVLARILTEPATPSVVGSAAQSPVVAAVALRSRLDAVEPSVLSPTERALLADWLDRIAADRRSGADTLGT